MRAIAQCGHHLSQWPYTLATNMPPPAEPQESITILDGKGPKLRASCDACNESKVRCSQSKPICARCEKHDMFCIYSLSRRTPPTPGIGASAATRHRAYSTSNSGSSLPRDGRQVTLPTTPATEDMDLLVDLDLHNYELTDYAISPPLQMNHMDPMQNILTPPNDFFSDRPSLMSPGFNSSTSLFTLMSNQLASERSSSEGGACNCSTRVIRKLLSIPLSLHGGNPSFDGQLSELVGCPWGSMLQLT